MTAQARHNQVFDAMLELARGIMEQYELGNLSTARAMLNNVPGKRKAYVGYALTKLNPVAARNLIMSVTE